MSVPGSMRARASLGVGRLVASPGMVKSSRMKNLYSSITLANDTEVRFAGKVAGPGKVVSSRYSPASPPALGPMNESVRMARSTGTV